MIPGFYQCPSRHQNQQFKSTEGYSTDPDWEKSPYGVILDPLTD